MQHDGESSVEEILESIKKVIARDNRAGAVETRRRRERDGVAEASPDFAAHEDTDDEAGEVLELGETEIITESDYESGEYGNSELEDDFAEADDLNDKAADDGTSGDAPLIADAVSASMRANFAALSMISKPGAQPQIVRSGETSLEGLTRELLRPMLSEWLDANLPDIVERMVKAEIARIAGKRG